MPASTDVVKCRFCNEELMWGELRQHHKDKHPDQLPARKKREFIVAKPSVFDKFAQIQKDLKETLDEIDLERNRLHEKLRQLDDLAAKYKKLL